MHTYSKALYNMPISPSDLAMCFRLVLPHSRTPGGPYVRPSSHGDQGYFNLGVSHPQFLHPKSYSKARLTGFLSQLGPFACIGG